MLNNIVTLKSKLGVNQGHWESIDRIRVFHCIYGRIFTVLEIKRGIGAKTPIFHTPFLLACTMNPLDFFLQNFNTNCPSSKAIKILPKTSSLRVGRNDDRGQTDGRTAALGERNVVTFA